MNGRPRLKERVICILVPQGFDPLRLAEACYRYTPQIAVGARSVFLEVAKCRRLYSEETILLRCQILAKRFAIEIQIAVADDIPTAKAYAWYQREDLPIEAMAIYLDPFEDLHSSRFKAIHKTSRIFRQLGIKSLKEFLDLPIESVTARFGREALLARHQMAQAQESLRRPWPLFKPQQKILEGEEIEDHCLIQELEPLLFLLNVVVDRTLLRVRGKGELLIAAQFRIQQEKYDDVRDFLRVWNFDFALPQYTASGVVDILRERLNRDLQRQPLSSPVKKIEFEVIRTVASYGKQKSLFSRKEEEEENLNSIIARISDRLGIEKVFFASPVESYLPERSWTRSLSTPSEIRESLPLRPMRILKEPQILHQVDCYFCCKKKRWKIQRWTGPERISGEWWQGDEPRDYYRVLTESEEELWIFVKPDENTYYLHGIFD